MKLRILYLSSLLQQEPSYFERLKVEEIPSQMAEVFYQVQRSIGFQLGNFIFAISACIGGLGFALYKGPKFAGACLGYVPVFIIILATFGMMVKKSMG
jgi:ABC-type bacteriocin/lantibiotic exporter with double-glycine peptidase domain